MEAGDRLGPYEIVARLGAGGMGEVFKAHDARLHRDVAIKVSKTQFTERFSVEARATAALSHTNICHLYDVGPDYLVMEHIEGETLAGPLAFDDALPIIQQLIDGIEAAHERGIIHRDLKPANIKITRGGVVKILDFGLAKATDPARDPAAVDSPTLTMAATKAGTILGTAHYMSPEQARGKQVDKRTDIWSFGIIVYELLTGQQPFRGDSVVEVLGSVINAELDYSTVPARAQPLLRWCLEKDRTRRLASISDARRMLEEQPGVTSESLVRGRRIGLLGWAAAAVMLVVAALAWVRPDAEPPRVSLTIVPREGALNAIGGLMAVPEISPDGSAVLYVARGRLYVRRLDSLNATLVPSSNMIANAPFWSPDSSSVYYPTRMAALMKVRLPDGAPEVVMPLLQAFSRGGSATDEGAVLLSAEWRLLFLAAPGAKPEVLEIPGLTDGRVTSPELLPGGETFLFLWLPDAGTGGEIYLASLEAGKVADPILLLKNDTAVRYTPAGGSRILFVRGDNLYSQRLDLRRRTLVGDSQLVQENVGSGPGMHVDNADFSVSRQGTVAWRPGTAALSQATAFDRKGTVVGTSGPPSPISSLRLSPDEKRLLAHGNDRTWLFDVGQPGRLALEPDVHWRVWSPKESRLIGVRGEKLVDRPLSGGEIRVLGNLEGYPEDANSYVTGGGEASNRASVSGKNQTHPTATFVPTVQAPQASISQDHERSAH